MEEDNRILANKFIDWYMNNVIAYGDPFKEWWQKEGSASFFKFAGERGIEYIKETKN